MVSPTANAKIKYNNKLMLDVHINTIKGFMYDVILHAPQDNDGVVSLKVNFAKAVVWLESAHASKREFNLSNINTTSSNLAKEIIGHIGSIVRGDEQFLPPALIVGWTETGRYVKAEYTETSRLNPVTKQQEKNITFKFYYHQPKIW
jgi:hypothetical protein